LDIQGTVEDHSITSQEIPYDASLMGINEGRSAHDGNQNEFLGPVNGKVKHLSQ
jgi:hypothetical protein